MKFFSLKTQIPLVASFLIAVFAIKTLYGTDHPVELKKEVETLALEILSKMTDEEKIGQIIHIAIPKNFLDPIALEEIRKIKPGGVILFGMNFGTKEEIKKLNRDLQTEADSLGILPFLISTDQEGGRVIRINTVQDFPGAMAIGQVGNEFFTEKVGFYTSYQLSEHGINLLLAPVLDINNNPENPVINTRSFGSDLTKVLKMSLAYQKGAMEGGSIPVVKHFPGHGDTNIDSHLGLPVIQKSFEELLQTELVPFQKSIENGIRVIMSAHIVFPSLDPKYPATLSPQILTSILREKLQFDGVVMTDAMEMKAIADHYFEKKPAKLAILAGADIILLTSWGKTTSDYKSMLEDAVKEKAFLVNGKNLLDHAVKNQIILKLQNGLVPKNCCVASKTLLEKFLQEKKEKKEKRFQEHLAEINPIELNKKLSTGSIRSYKKEFFPLKEKDLQKIEFFVKNPFLRKNLLELGAKEIKLSKNKVLKSKMRSTKIILGSEKKEDLDEIQKILAKNKKRKFLLLHYGSPFLEFPKSKNIEILFSFSPTKESLRSLAYSISSKYRKTPIGVPELILKK